MTIAADATAASGAMIADAGIGDAPFRQRASRPGVRGVAVVNPARVIRIGFADELSSSPDAIAWWGRPSKAIRERIPYGDLPVEWFGAKHGAQDS